MDNILEFKECEGYCEVWGTDEAIPSKGRYLMGTIVAHEFILTDFRVSDRLTVNDMTQIIKEIERRQALRA